MTFLLPKTGQAAASCLHRAARALPIYNESEAVMYSYVQYKTQAEASQTESGVARVCSLDGVPVHNSSHDFCCFLQ